MTMTILALLFLIGWVAASVLGTQAYFLGEQSKPIHERNWRAKSFEQLSKAICGKDIDYSDRIPAYPMNSYTSSQLPN